MCKILVFTNASKLNVKRIANAAGRTLLKSEKDGFGYAVKGPTNVFGEKCISSNFTSRLSVENVVKDVNPQLPIRAKYSQFGVVEKPHGPALFHGRTSTNSDGLVNTHPMQRDGWHLIHNGVVSDHGDKYDKQTQNDSEDVLFRLIGGIDQIEKHLTGYYAFGAIDPDGLLHMGKDDVANLYVAWSKDLESWVFGTTETLIKSIASQLKFKIGPIDELESNTYLVFEGNQLIHTQSIKPRGFERSEADWAKQSLGREIIVKGDDAPKTINDFLTESDAHNRTLTSRENYELYLRELENMDASYKIVTLEGRPISTIEFHKLDVVSQELCTIVRADGSVLDPDDYYTFKYRKEG